MTEQEHPMGILGRLGAVATLLMTLAGTASSGTSLELSSFTQPRDWSASNAAVTDIDQGTRRARAAELALAEVRTTGAILDLPNSHLAPVFREFVELVTAALDAYDASARDAQGMIVLATTLALARVSLQDRVGTLQEWATIARMASPSVGRYVRIPDRLVAKTPFRITREIPPTANDVSTLFEFDDIVGA